MAKMVEMVRRRKQRSGTKGVRETGYNDAFVYHKLGYALDYGNVLVTFACAGVRVRLMATCLSRCECVY